MLGTAGRTPFLVVKVKWKDCGWSPAGAVVELDKPSI
jgi:hypothetical protein